jgi:hypothetical protein
MQNVKGEPHPSNDEDSIDAGVDAANFFTDLGSFRRTLSDTARVGCGGSHSMLQLSSRALSRVCGTLGSAGMEVGVSGEGAVEENRVS